MEIYILAYHSHNQSYYFKLFLEVCNKPKSLSQQHLVPPGFGPIVQVILIIVHPLHHGLIIMPSIVLGQYLHQLIVHYTHEQIPMHIDKFVRITLHIGLQLLIVNLSHE